MSGSGDILEEGGEWEENLAAPEAENTDGGEEEEEEEEDFE